jgi:uncharacterized membrane protein YoaK (UPF0700 family)
MSIAYLASLTARPRSARADLHLGLVLAFVAGALNAGGFLAIGQYTSHITGMVSALADQLVLGQLALAGIAAISWIAFTSGAAATAMMVNYLRRNGARNVYAIPLLAEALLILVFGTFGGTLSQHELADVSLAVITLCFTMGLQNALITKISMAEIRTTHLTGLTTDLGIDIGKLLYWNSSRGGAEPAKVRADVNKMRIHASLIGAFLLGAITGALSFSAAGFISTVPLAVVLARSALHWSCARHRVCLKRRYAAATACVHTQNTRPARSAARSQTPPRCARTGSTST